MDGGARTSKTAQDRFSLSNFINDTPAGNKHAVGDEPWLFSGMNPPSYSGHVIMLVIDRLISKIVSETNPCISSMQWVLCDRATKYLLDLRALSKSYVMSSVRAA